MFCSYLHPKFSKILLLAVLLVASAFTFRVSAAISATPTARFEVPGFQAASEVLPRELIAGPHYRVQDKVISYGYMRHYSVDSDFGPFQVTGDFALRKLIKEIGAIASLQQVKKSDAYLNGIKNAASKPLEFGANLIDDPVDTISGVPKGVATLFQNVKTGLSSKSSKGEDSKAAQLLAMSSSKRELAKKLGVDVYSNNKVLQKELNSVAWATAVGGLTLSAALMPVGGPAVAAVSVTRTAQQMSDMVNEYPPQRLRQVNEQKLQAMGISADLIGRFLDNQAYTPTQNTIIAHSLETLSGAKGRNNFMQLAITAQDEELANFFQYVSETLKGYHSKVAPIEEISVYGPLVFARARNGMVMVPLPLDHAIWTERAGERVPAAIAAYKSTNPKQKKFEFWVTGTVSKLAKQELSKNGIDAVEKVGSRLEYTY
ncbi:MAG: hypothetical protein AB9866_30565 [Syntrophobacteraceae bacterium]